MAKTINSDLIRGNINTIILKALYDSDRYGYDIIREIEQKSHGQYILKQPTLYSCLKRLENQGFIESYWGEEQTSNGGRRKYYRLTNEGKEIFKQSQDEYEYSRTVIDNLISDNQYDLSSLAPLENTEKDSEEISEPQSEEKTPENKPTAPQQMTMDVSELEVTPSDKPVDKNVTECKQVEKSEKTSENPQQITVAKENTSTRSEYVQPAPVFTEKTEEATENKPVTSESDKKNGTVTAESAENDAEKNVTQPTEHKDLPKISNSEYINSLLNQNSGSYFGRNEDIESESEAQKQPDNSIDDDISKKLEALRASYNKELEQAEEHQQNIYFAPPPASTYQPKPVFIPEKSDFSRKTPTYQPENTENYENGFYKYNVQHSGINTAQDSDPVVYRPLSSLMETETQPQAPITPQPKPVSIKEQIKIRNFGKLSESIEELGEHAKVRPHHDTKHDYNKLYYYRDSYMRLFHFGILFVILLLEIFAAYTIGKQLIGANTTYDVAVYIISIIGSFLLPLIAGTIFLHHPNSKKRNDYNLKSSLIFRIIVAVQLILIIYAINIWMGMPITFDSKYFVTLAIPMIFAINIPISALIYNGLRKNPKFALKE